jgi:hypothetical protein
MTRFLALFLAGCVATSAWATTSQDLRSRISIDGRTSDFEYDEWVLDATTPFGETPGDSRWGRDNDISAIAITWDDHSLYVAVSAVTERGTLMLLVDTMCGGAADLTTQDEFLRNIEFGGITPNFLLRTDRISAVPVAAYLDCTHPLELVLDTRYQSVYLQNGVAEGALEIAIPWDVLGDFETISGGVRLPSENAVLRVVALVTGGPGTGAGDAAPDGSVVLENDSTSVAVVDNHIILPLDADGDGMLDAGVSPRESASYAVSPTGQGTTIRQPLSVRIPLAEKLFSPLREDEARFPVELETAQYTEPVYVTARVFSSGGNVVRTLLEETPVDFSSGTAWVSWDFQDDRGRMVPGGVYILAVSGGVGSGTPGSTAKAAFAVVR